MADNVAVDFDEWHDHANWWEAEGPRVRERLSVDAAALERARSMFGELGADTVGAALQDVLRARAAAGHALGTYCEGVASHIRSSLDAYSTTEESSRRILST